MPFQLAHPDIMNKVRVYEQINVMNSKLTQLLFLLPFDLLPLDLLPFVLLPIDLLPLLLFPVVSLRHIPYTYNPSLPNIKRSYKYM